MSPFTLPMHAILSYILIDCTQDSFCSIAVKTVDFLVSLFFMDPDRLRITLSNRERTRLLLLHGYSNDLTVITNMFPLFPVVLVVFGIFFYYNLKFQTSIFYHLFFISEFFVLKIFCFRALCLWALLHLSQVWKSNSWK